MTLRDALGFRPVGRYDRATDSLRIGRIGPTGATFTAPGLRGAAQPDVSSYAPSKNWNGIGSKPKVVSPKSTSQTTARHELGSVGVLSPGLPLLAVGTAQIAEAAGAALALGMAALGVMSGVAVLSLSGDSSGVTIHRNDAASGDATSASASDARSGSGSPNCDSRSLLRGYCAGGEDLFGQGKANSASSTEIGGEASKYDLDELAEFARGHSGDGWADGAPRPSVDQIRAALENANPYRRVGSDGLIFDFKGVRVIVNEENPFRSTGFFDKGAG